MSEGSVDAIRSAESNPSPPDPLSPRRGEGEVGSLVWCGTNKLADLMNHLATISYHFITRDPKNAIA